MPNASHSSLEESLAAAKQQVDELLAHPEKADEWLKTPLVGLKDCIAKTRCGWPLKEINQYLHAAKEAVTSVHNIVKKLEAGIEDFSDICDIIEQAATCVYNCEKSDAYREIATPSCTVNGRKNPTKSFTMTQ